MVTEIRWTHQNQQRKVGIETEMLVSLFQLFYSLRWPIYVFNSVVNTQLPAILSHRRSTKVSLETYPLYSFSLLSS